ncbi:catalase [Telmatospirillum siberiense]|uniref:Catalase n=2 Tax=Telmatospirillum siberiense TaxID=382514 RepID=A0A2N3PV64_9PROT|nr:catalase [Telmatospirillum siberiense]
MEIPEEEEAETGRELVETLRKIAETTYKDGGHALRAVHAKSHGLLKAELIVEEGLPDILAQGLFAKPLRHPAVMRFSTTPGDLLDDNVSTPRGLALKVLDVDGPRLPGSESARTQDFLFVNGKTFSGPNGKAFLDSLKLLALTTDKGEGLKVALSTVFQAAERGIEALGGKSGTIISLGGHPETNILGESFFGQVPFLYGPYVAKIAVIPVSANLTTLIGAKVDLHQKPNGLREAVIAAFSDAGGEWDVRIQLATNLKDTPIEDSSKLWPEDKTPFVTVARLVAGPQIAWSEERHVAVDDGMAFSPWHGLAAHRPLGSIMRMRKAVYEMSADFRSTRNRCPVHEPASLESIVN